MTAATYNKVNASLSKHGVELVKGNGYHYFADLDSRYNGQRIPSVMDGGFLRSMTLEQWVKYVEDYLSGKDANFFINE